MNNSNNPVLPQPEPLPQASTSTSPATQFTPTNQTFTVPTMPSVDTKIEDTTPIEDIPKPYNELGTHILDMGTTLAKDVNARQQNLIGNNYSPSSQTLGVNPVSYQQYYQPQVASAASNLRYTGLTKAWQTGAQRAADAAQDRLNKAYQRYNNYVQSLQRQAASGSGSGGEQSALEQQQGSPGTASVSIPDEELKEYGLDRTSFEALDKNTQDQYLRQYIDAQLTKGGESWWNDQSIRDYASQTAMDKMGITDQAQRDKIMQQGTQENSDFFGNPEVGDLWTDLYVERKTGMTGWVDSRNNWQNKVSQSIDTFIQNGGGDDDWNKLFEEANMELNTTLAGTDGAMQLDATYRLQSVFNNNNVTALRFKDGSTEDLRELADSLTALGFDAQVNEGGYVSVDGSKTDLEKADPGNRSWDQIISYLDEQLSKCYLAYGDSVADVNNTLISDLGINTLTSNLVTTNQRNNGSLTEDQIRAYVNGTLGDDEESKKIRETIDKWIADDDVQYIAKDRVADMRDLRDAGTLINLHDSLGAEEQMKTAAEYFLDNSNFKTASTGFGSIGGWGIYYSTDTRQRLENYKNDKVAPVTVNTADAVATALALDKDELKGLATMQQDDPTKFRRYLGITMQSMYDPIVISDGTLLDANGNTVPAGNYVFYHAPGTESLESYKQLVQFLKDKPAVLKEGEDGMLYWEGGFSDDADEDLGNRLLQDYWRDANMTNLTADSYSNMFEDENVLRSSAWSQAVMWDYYHNTPGVDEDAKKATDGSTFGGTKTYDIVNRFNALDAQQQQHFIEYVARKAGWKEFSKTGDEEHDAAVDYNQGNNYGIFAEGDNISNKDAAALLYIIQKDSRRVADDGTFYGQFKPKEGVINSDTVGRIVGAATSAFNESVNFVGGMIGLVGGFAQQWYNKTFFSDIFGNIGHEVTDEDTRGLSKGDATVMRLFGNEQYVYDSANIITGDKRPIDFFNASRNMDARREIENFEIFSGYREQNTSMEKVDSAGYMIEGLAEMISPALIATVGKAAGKVGLKLAKNAASKAAKQAAKRAAKKAAKKAAKETAENVAEEVVEDAAATATAGAAASNATKAANKAADAAEEVAEKEGANAAKSVGDHGLVANLERQEARSGENIIGQANYSAEARATNYFDDVRTPSGAGMDPELTYENHPLEVAEDLAPHSFGGEASSRTQELLDTMRSIDDKFNLNVELEKLPHRPLLSYESYDLVKDAAEFADTTRSIGSRLVSTAKTGAYLVKEWAERGVDVARNAQRLASKGAHWIAVQQNPFGRDLTQIQKYWYNVASRGQLAAYAKATGRKAGVIAHQYAKIGRHGQALVTTIFNHFGDEGREAAIDMLQKLYKRVEDGFAVTEDDVIAFLKSQPEKIKTPLSYRVRNALYNELRWNTYQLYMSPAHYSEDEWDQILSAPGHSLNVSALATHFTENAIMNFAVSNLGFGLAGKAIRYFKANRYTTKLAKLTRELEGMDNNSKGYIKKLNKLSRLQDKANALYDNTLREFSLRGASPKFREAYDQSVEAGEQIIKHATKIMDGIADGSIKKRQLSKSLKANLDPSRIRGAVSGVMKHNALTRRQKYSADFRHLFTLSTEDGLRWQSEMARIARENGKLTHEEIRAKQLEASNKFMNGAIPESEAKAYFQAIDNVYNESVQLMDDGSIKYVTPVGGNKRPEPFRRRKGYIPETGLRERNDLTGGQVAYAGLGNMVVGQHESADFRKGRSIPMGYAADYALNAINKNRADLRRSPNLVSVGDADYDLGRLNVAASNPVDNLNALINSVESAKNQRLIDAADFMQANKVVVVDSATMKKLNQGDRDITFAGTKRQQKAHMRATGRAEELKNIELDRKRQAREERKQRRKKKIDKANDAKPAARRQILYSISKDIDNDAEVMSIAIDGITTNRLLRRAEETKQAREAATQAEETKQTQGAANQAEATETRSDTEAQATEAQTKPAESAQAKTQPAESKPDENLATYIAALEEFFAGTEVDAQAAGAPESKNVDLNQAIRDYYEDIDEATIKENATAWEETPEGMRAGLVRGGLINVSKDRVVADYKAFNKNKQTLSSRRRVANPNKDNDYKQLNKYGIVISEKSSSKRARGVTIRPSEDVSTIGDIYNRVYDKMLPRDKKGNEKEFKTPEEHASWLADVLIEYRRTVLAAYHKGLLYEEGPGDYRIVPTFANTDGTYMDDMFKVYKPATYRGTQEQWTRDRSLMFAAKEEELYRRMYNPISGDFQGRLTDAEYSQAIRGLARTMLSGDVMPSDLRYLDEVFGSRENVSKFFKGVFGADVEDIADLNMAKLEAQATKSLIDAGYNARDIVNSAKRVDEDGNITSPFNRYLEDRERSKNGYIASHLHDYSVSLGGRRLVRSETNFIAGAYRIPKATYIGGVPLRTYAGRVSGGKIADLSEWKLTTSTYADILLGIEKDSGNTFVITGDKGEMIGRIGNPNAENIEFIDKNDLLDFKNRLNDMNSMSKSLLLQQALEGENTVAGVVNKAFALRARYVQMLRDLPDTANNLSKYSLDTSKLGTVVTETSSGNAGSTAIMYHPKPQRMKLHNIFQSNELEDFMVRRMKGKMVDAKKAGNKKAVEQLQKSVERLKEDLDGAELEVLSHEDFVRMFGDGSRSAKVRPLYKQDGNPANNNYSMALVFHEGTTNPIFRRNQQTRRVDEPDPTMSKDNTVTIPVADKTNIVLTGDMDRDLMMLNLPNRSRIRDYYEEHVGKNTYGVETVYRFVVDGSRVDRNYLDKLSARMSAFNQVKADHVNAILKPLRKIEDALRYRPQGSIVEELVGDDSVGMFDQFFVKTTDGNLKLQRTQLTKSQYNPTLGSSATPGSREKYRLSYTPKNKLSRRQTADGYIFRDAPEVQTNGKVTGALETDDGAIELPRRKGDRRSNAAAFRIEQNTDGTETLVYRPKGVIEAMNAVDENGNIVTKYYDVYSTGPFNRRVQTATEIEIPEGFTITDSPLVGTNPMQEFLDFVSRYGITRLPLGRNADFRTSRGRVVSKGRQSEYYSVRSKSNYDSQVDAMTEDIMSKNKGMPESEARKIARSRFNVIDESAPMTTAYEYNIIGSLVGDTPADVREQALKSWVGKGARPITLADVMGVHQMLSSMRNADNGTLSVVGTTSNFDKAKIFVDASDPDIEGSIIDGYSRLLNDYVPSNDKVKVNRDARNVLMGDEKIDMGYQPTAMSANDRRAFTDAWAIGTASRNVEADMQSTVSRIQSPVSTALTVADNSGIDLPQAYRDNLMDQTVRNARENGDELADTPTKAAEDNTPHLTEEFRNTMRETRDRASINTNRTNFSNAQQYAYGRYQENAVRNRTTKNTGVYYDAKAGIMYATKEALDGVANLTGRTFSNAATVKTFGKGTESVADQIRKAIDDDINTRQTKSGLYVPGTTYLSDQYMDLLSTYNPGIAGSRGGTGVAKLFETFNQITNMQLSGGLGRFNALTTYEFRSAFMSRFARSPAQAFELFDTWVTSRSFGNIQKFLNSHYSLDRDGNVICTRDNILELYTAVSGDSGILDAIADAYQYNDITGVSKIGQMVDDLKAQVNDAKVNGNFKDSAQGAIGAMLDNIFDDPTFKRYLPILQLEMICQDYRTALRSNMKTLGTNPTYSMKLQAMEQAVEMSDQYWNRHVGYSKTTKTKLPNGKTVRRRESHVTRRAQKMLRTKDGGMTASTFFNGLFFAAGFRANAMSRILNGIVGLANPLKWGDRRYSAGRSLVLSYAALAVVAQTFNYILNGENALTRIGGGDEDADYTKVGLSSSSDPNDIWQLLMNLDELGTLRLSGYDEDGINFWSSMMTIPNTTVRFAAGVANSFLPYPYKIETSSAGPAQEVISMFTSPLKSIAELFAGTYYGYSIWGRNASAIDEDGNIVENSPLDDAIAIASHLLGTDTTNKRGEQVGGSGLLQHEFYDAWNELADGDYGSALFTALELPSKSAPDTVNKARNSINNYVMPAFRQYKREYDEKLKNEDMTPEEKDKAYLEFVNKSLNQVALWSKRYNVLEDKQTLIPYAQRVLLAFLADEYDENTLELITAYEAAGINALGGFQKKSSETEEEYEARMEEVNMAWSKQKDKEYAARQALRQLGYDPVGFDFEDAQHKRYAQIDEINAQFKAVINGEIDGYENMKDMKKAYNEMIQSYREQKNWDMVRALQAEYINKLDAVLSPFLDKYGHSALFKYYDFADMAADLVIIPMDDKKKYTSNNQNLNWLQDHYGVGYKNSDYLIDSKNYYSAYNKLLRECLSGKAGLAATRAQAMLEAVASGRMVVNDQQLNNLIELESRLKAASK